MSLRTCVCMSPLPAAIKGGGEGFPGEGVHVDTVAVSLFLVCIWNFLVGGGGRVIGWQHFRKRELPHSEKRRDTHTPHWLQLLCGTKGATAPDAAWGASPDLG